MNHLPWGQTLTNWEEIINWNQFTSSISTFYIKSNFATTNKRFIAHYPNLVMGFLPMWFNNLTFNLKQISWVNINVSYKLVKMILWIAAILYWISNWDIALMMLFIVLWLILFLTWIQVYITVSTSWWITNCPIVFREKSKAQELINNLNSTIAENS